MSERRFWSDASHYFDKAAALSAYPRDLLEQIKRCNSLYRFDFSVRQVDGITDLRTAGFYLAIDRVARSYVDLGVFP